MPQYVMEKTFISCITCVGSFYCFMTIKYVYIKHEKLCKFNKALKFRYTSERNYHNFREICKFYP